MSRSRCRSRPWITWPPRSTSTATCSSSSTPRAWTWRSSGAGEQTLRRATAVIVESVFYPHPAGPDAPTFEDIAAALHELGYVYRGNVRLGCRHGTPMLADVLFARREAARRLVDSA